MTEKIEAQIKALQTQILELEREVSQVELECQDIKQELADFEKRYNELVKPLTVQIKAVKDAISSLRELQLKKQLGQKIRLENLWQNINATPPPEPEFEFNTADKPNETKDGKNIKQLYRSLARRFHPDLAKDEPDRDRRTKLMAMINHFYHESDYDSLKALDDTAPNVAKKDAPFIDSNIPLTTMILRRLTNQYADLVIRLRDLKEERDDLRYGSMMGLKLEDSLARARGEDLLTDLAQEYQQEYWDLMHEMQQLRQDMEA